MSSQEKVVDDATFNATKMIKAFIKALLQQTTVISQSPMKKQKVVADASKETTKMGSPTEKKIGGKMLH